MSFDKEKYRERAEEAVENRDVKAVTRLLHHIMKAAGPDTGTIKCVTFVLAELSSTRRNWEHIGIEFVNAINALHRAIAAGAADDCISFDHKHKDTLGVRCAQAERVLGDIYASSLHSDPEYARDQLERIVSCTEDMIRITES